MCIGYLQVLTHFIQGTWAPVILVLLERWRRTSWDQSFLIYKMVTVPSEGLFPVWSLFLCFIDLHCSLLSEKKNVEFGASKGNRNVQILLIWESMWPLRRVQLQLAERFSVCKLSPQGQESSKNTANFVEHANEFCKSYLCVCMKTLGLGWSFWPPDGHRMQPVMTMEHPETDY